MYRMIRWAVAAVAAVALDAEITRLVLLDYTTAPIDEKLRATLGLLRKMTLEPEQLTAADVRPVLALGVSRQAVADAMNVAFLFAIYDRLADTLGWDVPAQDAFYEGAAQMLLKRGYGVKDSSALLGAHGGMLDRVDALLFVAPVVYYYARLVVLP